MVTIEQLARRLEVEVREVTKVAARTLPEMRTGDARDAQFRLSRYQCAQIEHAISGHRPLGPDPEEDSEDEHDPAPRDEADLVMMLLDPITRTSGEHPRLRLAIHQDVFEKLEKWDQLRKNTAGVLERLAAHGRTSVVKGCATHDNRGWRRSPLGGNGKMQFYLWWAVKGTPKTTELDLPRRTIVVRDIRHHDEHEHLSTGHLDDYLTGPSGPELEEEIGVPATPEQQEFTDDASPVRIAMGQPGSGKTTALWRAIEARGGNRVLYVTLSRELTRTARERLDTFAPDDVTVIARDYLSLVGEILGTDVERRTIAESEQQFVDTMASMRMNNRDLGVWRGHERALHAEIRAEIIGAAVPGEPWCAETRDVARIDLRSYRNVRAVLIGERAARSAGAVATAIGGPRLAELFPELAAATRAIEMLGHGRVPEGLTGIDRIVVDEIQDLTCLELAVIVELCRACERTRETGPWILLAGDEGQTVRPSGFEWSRVNTLMTHRVHPVKRFVLEGSMRCPRRIAEVVERASALYGWLGKTRRPRKQHNDDTAQALDAQVFEVEVENRARAVKLVSELAALEDLVVLHVQDRAPDWLPDEVRSQVMGPAEVKGHEYQNVCLLEPVRAMCRITEAKELSRSPELFQEHMHRTAIDRLRVAISRSTEKLAFINIDPNEGERALSRDLLGGAVRYTGKDLVEHLARGDAETHERVEQRITESQAFIGENRARAWQCAEQAVQLIGDPELPNGVSDPVLREHAVLNLLATAARVLVDGVPDTLGRDRILWSVSEALWEIASDDTEREMDFAVSKLNEWTHERNAEAGLEMLDAATTLGEQAGWLTGALGPVAQELRSQIAESVEDPELAGSFDINVESWLRITGHVGDTAAVARELRIKAARTLLGAEPVEIRDVRQVVNAITPREPVLDAQVLEARGRLAKAARAFEQAGERGEALRVWRKAGRWNDAARFAEGRELEDLKWLQSLESTFEARPQGHEKRMTPGERDRRDQVAKSR